MVTFVSRPYASTVTTGIAELLPYDPAVTAVVAKSTVIVPLAVTGLPDEVILPAVPATVTEVTVPDPPPVPLLMDVTLPFASTVISELVYDPAVTPVLDNANVSVPDVVIGEPPTVISAEPVAATDVTVPVPDVMDVFVTLVIRPFASTVNTGTWVALPYVFAVTPELANVRAAVALADPLKETDHVASPVAEIVRVVVKVAAEPVVF